MIVLLLNRNSNLSKGNCYGFHNVRSSTFDTTLSVVHVIRDCRFLSSVGNSFSTRWLPTYLLLSLDSGVAWYTYRTLMLTIK